MIQIEQNVNLKKLNTLNLNVVASHYVRIHNIEQLEDALNFAKQHDLNILVLSGGSNVLLPEYIQALVLHMAILGVDVISDTPEYVQVQVGGGENWHEFVLKTTEKGWYGLQNLALIPGYVGASPVQNIGAYGVEVGEFIECVHVYDRIEQKVKTLTALECQFSYRDSIFKQSPNRYIIVYVTFKLLKQPILKLQYGDLKRAVGDQLTPENLQTQVIHIRQSKLPNPKEYPNVGSFFKNPVVTQTEFETLFTKFPQIPHYPQANGDVKIAAGWLIDQAGWKGKKLGVVGMFEKQALVLVNYADARLQDVRHTYQSVQSDVKQKFNIQLEPEPVLFDTTGQIRLHSE